MIEIGIGPAEPPKITWEKRTRGALPGCPPQCAHSQESRPLRGACGGMLTAGNAAFLLGRSMPWAGDFPARSSEMQLKRTCGKVSSKGPREP